MIKILGSTYWPRLSWYVMSLSCGLLQQLLEFYMLQGFQCSDETSKSELKFKSFSPKITSHVVQNYHLFSKTARIFAHIKIKCHFKVYLFCCIHTFWDPSSIDPFGDHFINSPKFKV